MRRTSFTPRTVVLFVALTLSLPPPVFALRTSQPEHESQLTGLEEALKDPDKALRQLVQLITAPVPAPIPAVPETGRTGLEEPEGVERSREGLSLLVIGPHPMISPRVQEVVSRVVLGWRSDAYVYFHLGQALPLNLYKGAKGWGAVLFVDTKRMIEDPRALGITETGIGEIEPEPGWIQQVAAVFREEGVPVGVIRDLDKVSDEDFRKVLIQLDQQLEQLRALARSAILKNITAKSQSLEIAGFDFVSNLAYDPVRQRLFILEPRRFSLWVFDSDTALPADVEIRTFRGTSHGVVFDPVTDTLYLEEGIPYSDSQISAFDVRTGRPTGWVLEGITSQALAFDSESQTLFVLEPQRLRSFAVRSKEPRALEIKLDGAVGVAYAQDIRMLFIAEHYLRRVRGFDPRSGEPTGFVIEDLVSPQGVAYDPDRRRLFVSEPNCIRAFDAVTGQATEFFIKDVVDPSGIVYDSGATALFVADNPKRGQARIRAFSAITGQTVGIPSQGTGLEEWDSETVRNILNTFLEGDPGEQEVALQEMRKTIVTPFSIPVQGGSWDRGGNWFQVAQIMRDYVEGQSSKLDQAEKASRQVRLLFQQAQSQGMDLLNHPKIRPVIEEWAGGHRAYVMQLAEWLYRAAGADMDVPTQPYLEERYAQLASLERDLGQLMDRVERLQEELNKLLELLLEQSTNGAGLEERVPGWMEAALGADWMRVVTGVHEMQVTDKVAVLIQPGLLGVAGDDGETQGALRGLGENLHGAFGWREETKLRLGLLTSKSIAAFEAQGYRVIRVVRHPESEQTPLPWEAVPIVVAQALAGGRPTFWVNVTPYLNLEGITLPEILSTLTDLFA